MLYARLTYPIYAELCGIFNNWRNMRRFYLLFLQLAKKCHEIGNYKITKQIRKLEKNWNYKITRAKYALKYLIYAAYICDKSHIFRRNWKMRILQFTRNMRSHDRILPVCLNSARRVDEYADNVAACYAKSRRTQHTSWVVGVARQYATPGGSSSEGCWYWWKVRDETGWLKMAIGEVKITADELINVFYAEPQKVASVRTNLTIFRQFSDESGSERWSKRNKDNDVAVISRRTVVA